MKELSVTIGHLMMAETEEEALPETVNYVHVLSTVDSKLRLGMGNEGMPSRILEPLKEAYDFIPIDNCPSLGTLAINALAPANEAIITVNFQLLAIIGLQDFLKTVGKIRSRNNNRLSVAGILLTMCDTRTNFCKVISEELADTFQGQVRIFDSRFPITVKVGESVYYSEPLIEYAPGNGACEAYRMLAKEVTCSTLRSRQLMTAEWRCWILMR